MLRPPTVHRQEFYMTIS